jgi:hypothetical protein
MKNASDFAREILSNSVKYDIVPCDEFSPYLIQRYISGVSPEFCNLINSVLNGKLNQWTDKQEILDFLKCIIPKRKASYTYFAAKKKSSPEYESNIEMLAEANDMSIKEVENLFNIFPKLDEEYVEDKEKILKAKN